MAVITTDKTFAVSETLESHPIALRRRPQWLNRIVSFFWVDPDLAYLASLDDHLLSDIGLNRGDVERALIRGHL